MFSMINGHDCHNEGYDDYSWWTMMLSWNWIVSGKLSLFASKFNQRPRNLRRVFAFSEREELAASSSGCIFETLGNKPRWLQARNICIIYLEPKWPLFWLEFRPCFGGLTFKKRGHWGVRHRYPSWRDGWIDFEIRNINHKVVTSPKDFLGGDQMDHKYFNWRDFFRTFGSSCGTRGVDEIRHMRSRGMRLDLDGGVSVRKIAVFWRRFQLQSFHVSKGQYWLTVYGKCLFAGCIGKIHETQEVATLTEEFEQVYSKELNWEASIFSRCKL